MCLKYVVVILIVGLTLLPVPIRADQKTGSKKHSQISQPMHNGPKEKEMIFQSVIVQSIDAEKDDTTVPLSLTKGKAITQAEDFMAPKWSPDGAYILLTKGKYRGLYLLSMTDQFIHTLSISPGVGYAVKWSDDSRFIFFGEEDNRKVFDLNGKQIMSEIISLEDEKPVVYVKDDAVYFSNRNTRKEVKISRDGDVFFQPQLSPDGKKIAYIGLSSGIHIRHLDKGKSVFIGLGTEINWMPDSKGIIYTHTRDDGHKIIDSDLYFAYADGSLLVNITNTPKALENHPDLGNKGLLYVVDGQVFLSELTYPRP